MSNLQDVARGLLIDAFITYVAICREKGLDGHTALPSWHKACDRITRRTSPWGYRGDDDQMDEIIIATLGGEVVDEHVETLIEERRGLIRDTMREELDEIENPGASAEDAEGIREQG